MWRTAESSGSAAVAASGEEARPCSWARTPRGWTTRAGCSCRRSSASSLADGLVVTRGQERCLYVFPMDEFDRLAEQMRAAPVTSKVVRDYLRVFLSGASDELPDKQGRITIPAALRDYAGLDRDCTVIGAGPRVEVWDATAWDRPTSPSSEQAFAEQAEEVVPGLLLTRMDHPARTAPRPCGEVSTRSGVPAHLPRCQAAPRRAVGDLTTGTSTATPARRQPARPTRDHHDQNRHEGHQP